MSVEQFQVRYLDTHDNHDFETHYHSHEFGEAGGAGPLVVGPGPGDVALPADVPAADLDGLAAAARCVSPSLSPGGSRLAYVSDAGGDLEVWIRDLVGGRAWPVPTGGDPVHQVSWSPAGDWLAVLVSPRGGVRTQVQVVRPDGSERRCLGGGTDRAAFLGPWSYDGGRLALSETSRPGCADAFLVDPSTGRRRPLARGGLLQVLELSRDGRRALIRRGRRGEREVALVDIASGALRVLRPGPGPGSTDLGSFSPDGRIAYLRTDVGRQMPALVGVPLDGSGAPFLVAARDDAELEHYAIRADGRRAAIVWNCAGRSEPALVELVGGRQAKAPRPGPPLPTGLGDGVAAVVDSSVFIGNGSRLMRTVQTATAPAGVWITDLGPGGRSVRLTPEPVGLPPAMSPPLAEDLPDGVLPFAPAGTALVHPRLSRFRSDDGLELTGWLFRPVGADGPAPTVISLHGGPEAQERPTFTPHYQALLAAGIAVFAPNVRGSSGFGRSFVGADNLDGRWGAIRDVAAAVRHLIGLGVAEPGRIACLGRSYGGYLTLAALVHHPQLFAAGVDICGIADFETFYAHTEPWIADAAVTKYGDPVRDRDLLRALSPLHRMDRLTAPLMVVHGSEDTNVPVYEAEQAVAAAQRHGVPVRYLLFPDEGHELGRADSKAAFAREVVAWLRAYLVDGPRPAAAVGELA